MNTEGQEMETYQIYVVPISNINITEELVSILPGFTLS